MEDQQRFICTICGQHNCGDQGWFLLVEDPWLDRLTVLHWNSTLAGKQHVHCLCSAAHLRELVAHWMATGSLEYPFVLLTPPHEKATIRGHAEKRHDQPRAAIPITGLIGELAVHRESLQRALKEHPQCLFTILEALLGALDHAVAQPKNTLTPKETVAVI